MIESHVKTKLGKESIIAYSVDEVKLPMLTYKTLQYSKKLFYIDFKKSFVFDFKYQVRLWMHFISLCIVLVLCICTVFGANLR